MDRTELIKRAAGPLPPFIKELRAAIRAGQKTQTRRMMKLQPESVGALDVFPRGELVYIWPHHNGESYVDHFVKCNYGSPGQIRYLREPIYKGPGGFAHYVDDDVMVWDGLTGQRVTWRWKPKTLSQLYMPKEMARTFVQLDAIRAERLQEISETDCKAEGVVAWHETVTGTVYKPEFMMLWDSINAKRGYPWAGNWWVWVLIFGLVGGHDGN